ncbi:MAG: 4-(cytidine 5'-diphospho)-2-C-methyl-D-erythritol kinase [Bryobacterales bacterium]|nr:4-(cytidine 5'-diphospho)-2-C-methyl-D-erythritol kinase [Bryobacterales bacterium]
MKPTVRRATFPALAKLNLVLKVLDRRRDGFHELRSVFQTISLADRIEAEFTPGRRTGIELESTIDVAQNLVTCAADCLLKESGATGTVRFRLNKRIPMGAGMGGGSSDAAAVLLGLPALTGRPVPMERLIALGASLGSDVPFFLLGGTALALGRGTELYPLPDLRPEAVLVVAPPVHVTTAEAYHDLGRDLTTVSRSPTIDIFQSLAWILGERSSIREQSFFCENDFERVVFRKYPLLKSIKVKLSKSGAGPALMTGSGAALFGVYDSGAEAANASLLFPGEWVKVARFVTRKRYRSLWMKNLKEHVRSMAWPPQSRYVR